MKQAAAAVGGLTTALAAAVALEVVAAPALTATAVAAAPVPVAALAALLACAAGTGWSKTPAIEHLAAADAPVFLAARSLACASLSSSCPIAASSSAVPLAPVAFPESVYLLLAFQKTCDLSSYVCFLDLVTIDRGF